MSLYQPAENPAAALRDHLEDRLAAQWPTLTYGLALPGSWDRDTSPPALVVFDDSGAVEWPIATRHTLRVVVWSDGLTLSRKIAARALGHTLTGRVPGLAQVLPGTGLLDSRDSHNGGIMVSYTTRARARVTLVTEP